MKRKHILILFLLSLLLNLKASPIDSISSVYKNGEYVTFYETRIKVSNEIAEDVADYLVHDFHFSPENLFNWALKDLGLQNKKDNELVFVIKPSVFDEKTGVTHGNFDIIVPHITTFKNVKVDAIVTKKQLKNGDTKVIADIIYSSLLLKHALGTVTIIPQKNNEQVLITNVSIKFGWFFNIFITKKRYKSIVEWRIKKFAENFKDECEKHRKLSIIHLN